ncbi:uncharacterized protein BYT42DRAFT_486320, partial [Radiomyces spectabilis]|uniref:uncharacterized protein n=1 Tax=Radiomyces spectabilis TaxID=64574 RepID=UPI00221F889E
DDDPPCTWLEDSECQENLFQILPLNPEETVVDSNNHIQTHIKLFFEELGYLTEEPEPIDPNVDYEALNEALMKERNNKLRRHHIDLSRLPSLD